MTQNVTNPDKAIFNIVQNAKATKIEYKPQQNFSNSNNSGGGFGSDK